MNVSSALNSIDSRISNCCKRACVAFTIVVAIAGSFILPASASAVDTTDWLEVDCDPHFLYTGDINADRNFIDMQVGHTISGWVYEIYALAYSIGLELKKDCTYHFEFVMPLDDNTDDYSFNITQTLPTRIADLPTQYNSLGESYLSHVIIHRNVIYIDYKRHAEFEIIFSTADGFIDNFSPGYNFVTLLHLPVSNTSGKYVEIFTKQISAKVVFDPSAEYYLEIAKEQQNKLADLTKESVGKMKESLEQVTIIDDMSSAVDYVSGAIGTAAALISPTTTFASGGVNIYPAFALFSNIYSTVMGSVDPALLALAATVPLLCFLAWLFSSLFKSLL